MKYLQINLIEELKDFHPKIYKSLWKEVKDFEKMVKDPIYKGYNNSVYQGTHSPKIDVQIQNHSYQNSRKLFQASDKQIFNYIGMRNI